MDNHSTEPLPADPGPSDNPTTINEGVTRSRIERFQKSTRPQTEETLKEKGEYPRPESLISKHQQSQVTILASTT